MEMTPNESLYTSVPISPNRISMEVGGLCFFSVPTSPTRRTTLRTAYEDDSISNFDEFEFDTSRRFNFDECEVKSRPEEPKESLPDMAFADELFSDGKVMPLKPPPGLEYRTQGSNMSSPSRSPTATGVLRLPFQRRSLWNDDFDPFMVALENVKDEKAAKYHRRTRSLSPFRERVTTPSGSSKESINKTALILPTKQPDPNSNKTMESNASENKQLKLAEPKGVVFARQARLVKAGNEKPRKTMDSTMEVGEIGKETGVNYGKQCSKGEKIKNLFRSGSMRKTTSNENKPECSANGTETKPKLKRKFSLRSMGISKYKEEKRVSEVTLTTLVQYRPKLLLCMGYGGKYVK